MTNQTNQPAEDTVIVTVVHTAFEDEPSIVARVTCEGMDTEEALEYAYRWTNNIDGSWSKGETMWVQETSRDEFNPDYNADVERLGDFPDAGRGLLGIRSTSPHDLMVVGSRIFTVASFGFEEIDYDLGNDHSVWMMPRGHNIPIRDIVVDVATYQGAA